MFRKLFFSHTDVEIAFCRLNAMFEVNTDLQKNIVSKISAELSWPSVLSSPRLVKFPLTNTNCSSVSLPTNWAFRARPHGSGAEAAIAPGISTNAPWLCFKEEEISLENPADVPVYVQFIPLALYPNPSVFADKLVSR